MAEGGSVVHTNLKWQCMTYLAAKEVAEEAARDLAAKAIVVPEVHPEESTDSSEEEWVTPPSSPPRCEFPTLSEVPLVAKVPLPLVAKALLCTVQERTVLSELHQQTPKSWDGIALDLSVDMEYDPSKYPGWDPTSRTFDQFTYREEELPALAVDLFEQMGIIDELGIVRSDISKMVNAARARYNNQPYHNFRHAFDVFQATIVLLHQSGLVHTASKVELLALLSSALLHDVGHVGLTNSFHNEVETPFAMLAKSQPDSETNSSNEYYHLQITREILLGDKGLLPRGRYTEDVRGEVDRLIQKLILATDPVTQSDYLKEIKEQMSQEPVLSRQKAIPERWDKVLCLILRCADIFHPLRPFHLHKKWALGIAEEFTRQGIMEAAKGIQPKPMMEQSTYADGLGKSTIDFINFLVVPLFGTFTTVFPSTGATKFMQKLDSTKVRWLSYDSVIRERVEAQRVPGLMQSRHHRGYMSVDERRR